MKTILVCSGKGGVGKTSVSVNLAQAMAEDMNVGVFDCDLACPNVPSMLGMNKDIRVDVGGGFYHFVTHASGLKVISTGFIFPHDTSCTLNGDKRSGLIKEFVRSLDWEGIDQLIVDLPPGTGDECCVAIEEIPKVAGVLIVVTGKRESVDDAERIVAMMNDMFPEVPIIGVVKNMSYVECPGCGDRIALFDDALNIEDELGVKIIAELPYKKLTPGDFTELKKIIVNFLEEE